MSTLQITEGQGTGKFSTNGIQAMTLPAVNTQNVTFTGTAGFSVTATSAKTNVVRLFSSAQCAVVADVVSSASVASSSGFILAANTPEYFATNGAAIFFSVISNS